MHIWLSIIEYFWVAFCLYTIATRLHYNNAYLAWIPLANILLLCRITGRPLSYLFYALIPVINLFVLANLWTVVAVRCGKPAWWGTMVIVPGFGLLFAAFLAFSRTLPEVRREKI